MDYKAAIVSGVISAVITLLVVREYLKQKFG